eukprot:TRINITY_DN10646_c0_g1_i1.p1 TRINITY_DN10646_c0_g1~~TRINITY_DN10646_c0_g1_i1.p1  ORF type:complete len:246 (+),score=113.52 TRINITY_DN10646_c0_g1_i1:55-738(+)
MASLDFSDPAKLFSQMLGYAIVGGSVSLKVPQIINIVRAGSSDGVSESTTLLEGVVFLTSFLYGQVKNMPLETYAENGICGIQVLVLFFMLMYYNRLFLSLPRYMVLAALGVYAYGFLTGVFNQQVDLPIKGVEPMPIYELLYLVIIPISLASKLPQILIFHKNKSTGNAAFLTWFLNFGGSAARVFTTIMQVGDPVMTGAYALNAFLGGVIILQFFMYWGAKEKKE